MKVTRKNSRTQKKSLSRMNYLGPPALMVGEDERAYNDLLAKISAAVKPNDILEEIWIRDVVDLTWEILRCRRLSAQLRNVAVQKSLKKAVAPIAGGSRGAAELIQRYAKRDEQAVAEVEALVAVCGNNVGELEAEAMASTFEEVAIIDRIVAGLEGRRNSALLEIKRHRAMLAEQLKNAVKDVEDAEYEVVAPEEGSSELPQIEMAAE